MLRAVLDPEVRAAVLTLFELGFHRVKIDDAIIEGPGHVEAYRWSFASPDPPAARGARCLAAFARVLDNLPAIAASGEAHASPQPDAWVRVLGWLGGRLPRVRRQPIQRVDREDIRALGVGQYPSVDGRSMPG